MHLQRNLNYCMYPKNKLSYFGKKKHPESRRFRSVFSFVLADLYQQDISTISFSNMDCLPIRSCLQMAIIMVCACSKPA